MELWIRSQDRKLLLKCEGIGIYKKHIMYELGHGFTIYGRYETEERALEILDEIQRHLVVINDKNDNLFYVYEMPKE